MTNRFAPQVEHKISGEELFCGKVLRLEVDTVSLPDGQESVREVIRHNGAVCVIPYDKKDNTIIMVSQYRYAVSQVMMEIPAGKLDSPSEPPLDAAKRELSEETGYLAHTWRSLGLYYASPAILDEKIEMFLALNLEQGEVHPDDTEYLSCVKVPLPEAVEQVLSGAWTDGKTACAILKLDALLRAGRLEEGDK
ncbi:MAG: NUDIX hydrolase [Clostridia bacterium]|nr:NUDIX hydrolase [Clostridia bacterium]